MQPATCEAKYTTAKACPEDRDLRRHLEGERTIAVPLIGADGLAVAGGLDVDEGGEGALLAALGAAQQAGLTAWAITSTNDEHDGGWVWFLYTSAVAPERIRAQLTALAVVAGVRADIFPTRQAARLPFGVHTWTGRRGILLLQDGRRFDLDSAELEAGIAAVLALSRNTAPPNIEAPPVPKPPPRRQPAVQAGADAIGRFCSATDLVDLLASYPGYSLVARSGQGGTMRCGCPGHKHGDRRPSLEVKHGRDGRQVAVGYAPGCIWHNQQGRNDAFNVYCELERLTPKEAVKRLASPLPAKPRSFPPHPAENTLEPPGLDPAILQARNREAERKRVARQEADRQVRAAVEQRLAADQALSKRGQAVLTHLLAFAGSRAWCRPSVARLVELTGYSERTVQYALRDLEAAGYLCSTPVEHGTSLRRFLAPLEASGVDELVSETSSDDIAPIEVAVGVRQLVEPFSETLAPIETAAQGEQQAATDDAPLAPVGASECAKVAPESQ
jgi:DNA-binding transcriptional ArsR family regulator